MAAAAERYRRSGPYQGDSDLRPGDQVRIGRRGLRLEVIGPAPGATLLVRYQTGDRPVFLRLERWRLARF
jgi:hypothetical protein